MTQPRIYVFSNVRDGCDGPCYAMAEDGTVLGSHWCSSENWAIIDLAVNDSESYRHAVYREHYPDGYQMEFVPVARIEQHEGLQAAFKLNEEKFDSENGGDE